ADQPKDSNMVVQAPKAAEKPANPLAPPLDPATPDEKTKPKYAKPEQKVLTPEEAIKQMPKEKVTVQFKVAAVLTMGGRKGSVDGERVERLILKHGDSFVVQLPESAMDTFKKLGIAPDKHFKGKVVRVTGLLGPGPLANLLPPGLYPDQYQIA